MHSHGRVGPTCRTPSALSGAPTRKYACMTCEAAAAAAVVTAAITASAACPTAQIGHQRAVARLVQGACASAATRGFQALLKLC